MFSKTFRERERKTEKQGKGYLGVWDGHVHTATFKMDSQQGPPV